MPQKLIKNEYGDFESVKNAERIDGGSIIFVLIELLPYPCKYLFTKMEQKKYFLGKIRDLLLWKVPSGEKILAYHLGSNFEQTVLYMKIWLPLNLDLLHK